jgi:methyltransferase (TIGR00027 family)
MLSHFHYFGLRTNIYFFTQLETNIKKEDYHMKDNQASFTAMTVAYMRAYHSKHATDKIFDDFLAYDLIPDEKRGLIEQHLIEQYMVWDQQLNDFPYTELQSEQTITQELLRQATSRLEGFFNSRARYAEDALKKAIKKGVKQYVILGAGMDTFAFRQPEMMEHLEVFEIDHPTTQEFKLHRLAELGWKHPAKLHFISVDFTKESLVTALTSSSSYDSTAKTFFSWLGVTYFLTRDEVFKTLRYITKIAPVDSTLVFDYFDTDAFIPEKSSPQMQKSLEYLRKIGEPMITGFNPSTLGEELASLGFRLHENLSPVNIEERYFQGRTDGYHAYEHGHFACAVVK